MPLHLAAWLALSYEAPRSGTLIEGRARRRTVSALAVLRSGVQRSLYCENVASFHVVVTQDS